MKIRLGILAVLASTILGAAGGTTQAAPQLITFDNDVSSAFNCFVEYPVSLDSSNFLFKTASGNTPFAWNLADGCNTNPRHRREGPAAPLPDEEDAPKPVRLEAAGNAPPTPVVGVGAARELRHVDRSRSIQATAPPPGHPNTHPTSQPCRPANSSATSTTTAPTSTAEA
jgi:hypothetical protein